MGAKRATVLGPGGVEGTRRALAAILGGDAVLGGDSAGYLGDETEGRGLHGRADAVALPATTEQVAEVVGWCYDHDVAIVPRGGGTGFAGGAVPVEGGVVVSLERMSGVLDFDPGLWRMQVEAGVRTATVRRVARENGLMFPPDPGAAEQSHIGGNIATNAGGPHTFKYGVTGAWVTGLEAVVPPGEVVRVGGPIRKDVAGYDLRGLMVGSEGTLGIVTSAWLRLLPAPAATLPVVAFLPDIPRGTEAIARVLESGSVPAALEFADAGTLVAAGPSFPSPLPDEAAFMVLAEADGSVEEAARVRAELIEAIEPGALAVVAPTERSEIESVWRWRDGVSVAVTALRGGKASEDIVVPVERLGEAIEQVLAIGRAHGLEACSWGHAGDGNLHATFLLGRDDPEELSRAARAADELFGLAVRLGGSISGEHGVGWVKRGELARQWPEPALRLHEEIKRSFDPKGLLNPGKKLARL
ncbi:MAG: FAD-binding oxidoreductase [Solirubrobacterales bacterium]